LKIITLFNFMAIKMNDAVPEPFGCRDAGAGDNSEFDGIDWSEAAPSWGAMFTGLVLPLLGFVLLVVSVDFGLSWLVASWASPSNMSPLLLGAIMFPPALIGAFGCCKLFLYLKDAMRTAARPDKRESIV